MTAAVLRETYHKLVKALNAARTDLHVRGGLRRVILVLQPLARDRTERPHIEALVQRGLDHARSRDEFVIEAVGRRGVPEAAHIGRRRRLRANVQARTRKVYDVRNPVGLNFAAIYPPRSLRRCCTGSLVWSSFGIADMDLWRRDAYMQFFEYLDSKEGDAPVHTFGVALFARKDQIHWFNEIDVISTWG
ncbi:hypothetical protein B0H17DRAFT_1216639 [Mycena rosella]|uniref:Uncharacterized protein n=1 Tax=Mycena rosella TaxID=1033263 RepID=A0AAD7C6N1_MYCRO|nr:hypothetical protein B0H17DRAFT_1216639 [Mycena rosella]